MNAKYKSYLLSEEWAQIKVDLIQLRGCCCQRCKGKRLPNKLQVHHLTYERIFHEEPADLILLCAGCHMKEHGIKSKKKKIQKVIQRKKHNKKQKHPLGFKRTTLSRSEVLAKANRGEYKNPLLLEYHLGMAKPHKYKNQKRR